MELLSQYTSTAKSKGKRKNALLSSGSKIIRNNTNSQTDIPTASDFQTLIPGLRTLRQKIKDFQRQRDKKNENAHYFYNPQIKSSTVISKDKKQNQIVLKEPNSNVKVVSGEQKKLFSPSLERITEQNENVGGGGVINFPTGKLTRNTSVPQTAKLTQGQATPSVAGRSQKFKQMQQSMSSQASRVFKKNQLPLNMKIPNQGLINELMQQVDFTLGKLDKKMQGSVKEKRETFLQKHFGNMHNFEKNIEGLKEKTDIQKNHQKLLDEIELLKRDLQFLKSDCTNTDSQCYQIGRRLTQLKNKNLQLQHESKFYDDQMEYAINNRESLNKEIQRISQSIARMQQEIKKKKMEEQVHIATMRTIGAYGNSKKNKSQDMLLGQSLNDQSSGSNTSKSLIRIQQKRAIQKAHQLQPQQSLLNNKSYQERILLQKQDYFSQISKQFHDRIRKLQNKFYKQQKDAITKEKQNKKLFLSVHPLQSHFQSCILLIKQQILQRKHPDKFKNLLQMHHQTTTYGGDDSVIVEKSRKEQMSTHHSNYNQQNTATRRTQKSIGSMPISQRSLQSHVDIVQRIKFNEFTQSDKRHSLELFLQDQQVKWFIYQSLFGHIQNDLLVPERKTSQQFV